MRKASSILILLFYAISIFGYGAIDFFHFAAHKIKNPVHHHGGHHHHDFQDHQAAKLLNQQNIEQHKAQKIVKAFFFFSFLGPTEVVPPLQPIKKSVFVFKQNDLKENSSPPAVPPPDLVSC